MLTMMKPASNANPDSDMTAVKSTTAATKGFSLRGGTKASPEKIDAAAHEFEAQFVSQMLSSMFATKGDPEDSLGGSDSEEVYNAMLENEYGKIIARTGGVGIADQVKRTMLSQQEVGTK